MGVSNLITNNTDDKITKNGVMSFWRLATNQGKMLCSMTPKWIRVLEEIEDYVQKKIKS